VIKPPHARSAIKQYRIAGKKENPSGRSSPS